MAKTRRRKLNDALFVMQLQGLACMSMAWLATKTLTFSNPTAADAVQFVMFAGWSMFIGAGIVYTFTREKG